MSSFKAFDIAGSGMAAQSVRLNTTASNLANADSVSGDPQPASTSRAIRSSKRCVRSSRRRARRRRSAAVRVRGIYESTAPASAALRAGQSAGRRQRLRVRAGGQRGRGDGQHDLRLALVPEQRRSHEHLQGPAAGHAAARPRLESLCSTWTSSTPPWCGSTRRSRPPPRAAANAANAKKTELNQDDFLTLMITQLKNQDPFKPMDPAQYVGQLAQFSSVSGLADMNKQHQRADRRRCAATRCSTAPALIGRTVIAAGQPGLSIVPADGEAMPTQGAIEVPAGASSRAARGTDSSGALVQDAGARRRARAARLHLGRQHQRRRAPRRPAPTRSKSSPRSATRTFP